MTTPQATKFRSPVGDLQERESGQLWPGTWIDATPHGTRYILGIHTGADLNNNPAGRWDADRFAPVYATASGKVIFARLAAGSWGKLVVIEHILPDGKSVYSRYAHLHEIDVKVDEIVECGQKVGTVGNAEGKFDYHLHFDMAVTDRVRLNPQHWAGHDEQSVVVDYVDPLSFIRNHWDLHNGAVTTVSSNSYNTANSTNGTGPVAQQMYAQVEGLRVRERASTTDSAILYELSRGESVQVSTISVHETHGRIWRQIVAGQYMNAYVAEVYDSDVLLAFNPPHQIKAQKVTNSLHSVFPVTYLGLHGNAGGWAPKAEEVAAYKDNSVKIAFIAAYQHNQASLTISQLRQAGVEHFAVRAIAPDHALADPVQFVEASKPTLEQYYNAIGQDGFFLQIHNEPNLAIEGWKSAWQNGIEFGEWFLQVQNMYRQAFPHVKIGFSPLSPGGDLDGERMSEAAFLAGTSRAIQESDWVAVHAYWQHDSADDLAIPLAEWQDWFGSKPLLATEVGPVNHAVVTAPAVRYAHSKFSKAGVAMCVWLADHTEDPRWQGASWTAQGLRL